MTEPTDRPAVEVIAPDGPPQLEDAGWRTLLGLLVDVAERELGPEWRERLAEKAEPAA